MYTTRQANFKIAAIMIPILTTSIASPMHRNKASHSGLVQRVSTFEDLFSTEPQQSISIDRLLHDDDISKPQEVQIASSEDAEESATYDFDYLANLLGSRSADDCTDHSLDPDTFYYPHVGSSQQWHESQLYYDPMHEATMDVSTELQGTTTFEDSTERRFRIEDVPVSSDDDDDIGEEDSYCYIYRHYTGLPRRKAQYRLNARLNDDLRGMMDSKNDDQIMEACRILNSRHPNDLFDIDEATALTDKLVKELQISRKRATTIIKLGSCYYPKERKADLYSTDLNRFNAAFEVLYEGYLRKNKENIKNTRKRIPRRPSKQVAKTIGIDGTGK